MPGAKPFGTRDDDVRKPLLFDNEASDESGPSGRPGEEESYLSTEVYDDETGLRTRSKTRESVRHLSFACAILSCLCAGSITAYSLYGHLFLARLRYTQLQVNIVSIAAELAMYLPVPLFGLLCDRYNPGILSLLAGVLFGFGYLLAALTYHHGPPPSSGGDGWPFALMVIAFVAIGMATASMYLSAVTTCAKNFGRGRYKGIALAVPIAAFGLSGMWLSQVGSRVLYETAPDGTRGDVDVFRFFLFLAITLLAVGALGAVALRIVDEEAMIDRAVEQLERSGLLDESEFFRRAAVERYGYGTLDGARRLSEEELATVREDAAEAKRQHEAEESRKKTWLLNSETHRFLADHTMWWLAAGFFLVTGPGEAFINNMGTIIGTLSPPGAPSPTSPATHVSIIALTSTLARLFVGTFTDLLAPHPPSVTTIPYDPLAPSPDTSSSSTSTRPWYRRRPTISRIAFLLSSALLLSTGQVLLASGAAQDAPAPAPVFALVSALVGAGYGAAFSLAPIIISVVWGVENFATNWGIVAVVPAGGATVWGIVYSAVYDWAARRQTRGLGDGEALDVLCYGMMCYAPTFWAMAISTWVACGLWLWAWKGPGGWARRGIAV